LKSIMEQNLTGINGGATPQQTAPPQTARKWLARLLLASSVVVLAAGLLVHRVGGISGSVALSSGEIADAIEVPSSKVLTPLGFSLVVQRITPEYGPTAVQVGIRSTATGENIGLLELREGEEASLSGTDLTVYFERLDGATGSLYLRLQATDAAEQVSFRIGTNPQHILHFDRYDLVLVAYRAPIETIRPKIAVLEDGNVQFEAWLPPGSATRWRDVVIRTDHWDTGSNGEIKVQFLIERSARTSLFWISACLALVALAAHFTRHALQCTTQLSRSEPMNRRRRILFAALLWLGVAVTLELGARLIESVRDALVHNIVPYTEATNRTPIFEAATESGTRVLRRTTHHPLVGGRTFLFDKPSLSYRVFLLGGSAASGGPMTLATGI
jgi:hypothetical protein